MAIRDAKRENLPIRVEYYCPLAAFGHPQLPGTFRRRIDNDAGLCFVADGWLLFGSVRLSFSNIRKSGAGFYGATPDAARYCVSFA